MLILLNYWGCGQVVHIKSLATIVHVLLKVMKFIIHSFLLPSNQLNIIIGCMYSIMTYIIMYYDDLHVCMGLNYYLCVSPGNKVHHSQISVAKQPITTS